jgi:hypothetical protein
MRFSKCSLVVEEAHLLVDKEAAVEEADNSTLIDSEKRII